MYADSTRRSLSNLTVRVPHFRGKACFQGCSGGITRSREIHFKASAGKRLHALHAYVCNRKARFLFMCVQLLSCIFSHRCQSGRHSLIPPAASASISRRLVLTVRQQVELGCSLVVVCSGSCPMPVERRAIFSILVRGTSDSSVVSMYLS